MPRNYSSFISSSCFFSFSEQPFLRIKDLEDQTYYFSNIQLYIYVIFIIEHKTVTWALQIVFQKKITFLVSTQLSSLLPLPSQSVTLPPESSFWLFYCLKIEAFFSVSLFSINLSLNPLVYFLTQLLDVVQWYACAHNACALFKTPKCFLLFSQYFEAIPTPDF